MKVEVIGTMEISGDAARRRVRPALVVDQPARQRVQVRDTIRRPGEDRAALLEDALDAAYAFIRQWQPSDATAHR